MGKLMPHLSRCLLSNCPKSALPINSRSPEESNELASIIEESDSMSFSSLATLLGTAEFNTAQKLPPNRFLTVSI